MNATMTASALAQRAYDYTIDPSRTRDERLAAAAEAAAAYRKDTS